MEWLRDSPMWKTSPVEDIISKIPLQRVDILGFRKDNQDGGKPMNRTWQIMTTHRGVAESLKIGPTPRDPIGDTRNMGQP